MKPLQHSGRTPSPAHIHVADESPGVRLRIVFLHTPEAVGAVEASNEEDLVVHDSGGGPGTRGVHGRDGRPLVGPGVVPEI